MNIMQKLTARYLTKNRQRTLTTIIGVIIAVSMITAVPTLVTSFTELIRRDTAQRMGNWHVTYKSISPDQVNTIQQDSNTESITLTQPIGYAWLPSTLNSYKPFLYVFGMDTSKISNYTIKLAEGRLPENAREVVLSNKVGPEGGAKYEIGDVIDLEIVERYRPATGNTPEMPLTQGDIYIEDEFAEVPEKFRVIGQQQYTVTGFIEPGIIENYPGPGFAAMSFLDPADLSPDAKLDAAVSWKKINRAANASANLLGEKLGLPAQNVVYNVDLLRYYGFLSDRNLITLYLLAAFVLTLITVGSVSLIHNAFAISLVERSRQFGMLSSVGATKAQNSSAIYSEAWFIGLVAIPLGMLFGTLGIGLTLKLIEPLTATLVNDINSQFRLATSPGTLITAAVLAAITLFASASFPARRAAKVSPIEAIRQTQDIRISPKDVSTSKLTRKMFGFAGELGLKNIKRNKRRFSVITFSLVISIVLFLISTSLADYAFGASSTKVQDFQYPIEVFVHSDVPYETQLEFFQNAAKLPEASSAVIVITESGTASFKREWFNPEIYQLDINLQGQSGVLVDIPVTFQLLDEKAYVDWLEFNGLDRPAYKEGILPVVLVTNEFVQYDGPQSGIYDMFTQKPEGPIAVEFLDLDGDFLWSGQFEVAAFGMDDVFQRSASVGISANPVVVASAEEFAAWSRGMNGGESWKNLRLGLDGMDPEALTNRLVDLQREGSYGRYYISNRYADQTTMRNLRTFVRVFFYGFVALITLVGVANISNTITTNIAQRKQEFAVLRSVGMEPDAFKRMIRFESLLIGLRALLIGLPVGLVGNYLVFRILARSFNITFRVPWLEIAIVILTVGVVIGATMLAASRNAMRGNIVDTLKLENY